jgi:hypothetical protein
MSFLDKLEKRFGHWAIPNVMLGLIIAQLLVYALILMGYLSFGSMPLVPYLVIEEGQFWRLVTFIVSPPKIAGGAMSGLFLAIFWYILWMMSQALEAEWGSFRFNLYLLAGILFTIAGALIGHLISPSSPIVVLPDFLYLSVFWGFALMHPNMQFYLFFVVPVKVKWLAILSGVFTLLSIFMSPSPGYALATLGPVLNFVLFFRTSMVRSLQLQQRRMSHANEVRERAEAAQHTCTQCAATERTHPDRDFRYRIVDGEAMCICDACR